MSVYKGWGFPLIYVPEWDAVVTECLLACDIPHYNISSPDRCVLAKGHDGPCDYQKARK